MSTETVKIELHECRIAARGRGAKGSVETKTFGVPNVDESTGLAESFDYEPFAGADILEAISAVQDMNLNPVVCILKGADSFLKSASERAKAAKSSLQALCIEAGIASKENAPMMADVVLSWAKANPELNHETIVKLIQASKGGK